MSGDQTQDARNQAEVRHADAQEGGHRLFENDPETAKVVSEMLIDLEKHGMDAVRKYSRQFDDWDPPDFELSERRSTRPSAAG